MAIRAVLQPARQRGVDEALFSLSNIPRASFHCQHMQICSILLDVSVAFRSRDVTLYLDNPLWMGYLDHFQYFAIINTTVMNGLVYTS